jgi:hypothetical protein
MPGEVFFPQNYPRSDAITVAALSPACKVTVERLHILAA